MTKIEVEHRGIITKEKFDQLKDFFNREGEFLDKKERFSIIYSQGEDAESNSLYHSVIDLKLRISNKEAELVLKHGEWSGNDARREFSFPVEKEKFEEMVEFLKILGHYHGVLQATTTYFFNYKEIDFSLVLVPDWGHYFEAEIVVDDDVEEANRKIESVCRELDLNILDHEGFCDLLRSLNEREGFRFNFKKEDFSVIRKRFEKYF